jgi:hypothetical protein
MSITGGAVAAGVDLVAVCVLTAGFTVEVCATAAKVVSENAAARAAFLKENEFFILSLDRLGGTRDGGHDTDVKAGGYALQGDMHLCVGSVG